MSVSAGEGPVPPLPAASFSLFPKKSGNLQQDVLLDGSHRGMALGTLQQALNIRGTHGVLQLQHACWQALLVHKEVGGIH